ncbi:expressed unknown protein [Seminavis robusta]|uniref:START domain-containing protein n=1 Tax=Seminavis robusta TaxID=568900 RepID=A0A9N8DUM3_9STRA|nr:expressed unknown protein [Seminavis robusta]|eukprot:Sro288_g108860.1 n/a (413) ;mRNA; r:54483-55721
MSAPRRVRSGSKSFSLGGGHVDENGSVVCSSSLLETPTKEHWSFNFKMMGSKGKIDPREITRTETNSSLDSDSVRDESLDVFLGDDCFDTGSGSGTNYSSMADRHLLQALDEAVEWEKQIAVSHILQEMDTRGLRLDNTKRQASLEKAALEIQQVLDDHLQNPEEQGGWKRQTIMHGRKRDTAVYNRMNDQQEITVRMETPIEASLLVPLLATLNETNLYTTWIPSFQRPIKLGVRSFQKMMQISRGFQIARCQVDMPWPMTNREIVGKIILADAVEELDAVAIRLKSIEEGEQVGEFTVPKAAEGWESIGVDAAVTFRKCPRDHPALKRHASSLKNNNLNDPLLLASFTLTVSPAKNFILKTIAGPAWAALIYLAEHVKKGKSAPHKAAIDSKPELYGWVYEVVERMTQKC